MTESDGWVTGVHPGYRTKVVKTANATIEINRPILAPEEQARREEEVKQAIVALMKGCMKK